MDKVEIYRCLNCFHPWPVRSKNAQSRRCSQCGSRYAVPEETWERALSMLTAARTLNPPPHAPHVALTDALEFLVASLPSPFIPPKVAKKLLEEAGFI